MNGVGLSAAMIGGDGTSGRELQNLGRFLRVITILFG